MEIDTGDAVAKKQAVRRMPFAVRSEVARQLHDMLEAGVVKPSYSPRMSLKRGRVALRRAMSPKSGRG